MITAVRVRYDASPQWPWRVDIRIDGDSWTLYKIYSWRWTAKLRARLLWADRRNPRFSNIGTVLEITE